MELHSENISTRDCARKAAAIMSTSYCFRNHRRAIRVGVVDKRAILNAAQQARVIVYLNPVPAHVRRLYLGGKSRALSGKQGGSGCLRRFRAAFEQPLHAYADSQERNSFGDGAQYGLTQAGIQCFTATEMAHTRH